MRIFLWIILSLGLLSLAGCLEMEQTIKIAADGSGTQTVVLEMSNGALAAVHAAAEASQTGSSDPSALFDRKAVESELQAVSLDLVEFESRQMASSRRVRVVAGFDTPRELRGSPLTGSLAEWEFCDGPVEGSMKVTLYPQGKAAWVEARKKALAMASGEVDAVVNEFFATQRKRLAGLDVTVRLELPGTVLSGTNNLQKVKGQNVVVARVTAADIKTPQDLMRRLAPRFEVVFDARGCSIPKDEKK